jgi:hypothetical protein
LRTFRYAVEKITDAEQAKGILEEETSTIRSKDERVKLAHTDMVLVVSHHSERVRMGFTTAVKLGVQVKVPHQLDGTFK